jgi:hypothetical protein
VDKFTGQPTLRGFTYSIELVPNQPYATLLSYEPDTGKIAYWILDLTTLDTAQLKRLRVDDINGRFFWAKNQRAFIRYTQFNDGSYNRAPKLLSLMTFDLNLTTLTSKDLLPSVSTFMPTARGFTPIAATDNLSKILVDGYPVRGSDERYDYFVIDTQSNQARRLEVERVLDAVWVSEDAVLIYAHSDAIYEYNWRTDRLKIITTLKEINSIGLRSIRFTPDGAYLVAQLAPLNQFLIFDMANIYPPKQ